MPRCLAHTACGEPEEERRTCCMWGCQSSSSRKTAAGGQRNPSTDTLMTKLSWPSGYPRCRRRECEALAPLHFTWLKQKVPFRRELELLCVSHLHRHIIVSMKLGANINSMLEARTCSHVLEMHEEGALPWHHCLGSRMNNSTGLCRASIQYQELVD